MPHEAIILPKRWVRLKQMLEREEWKLDRISGSHHIFTKSGRRCIPVAFHGGTVSPRYASKILQQAGLSNEVNVLEPESITEVEEATETLRLNNTTADVEPESETNLRGRKKKQKSPGEKAKRLAMAKTAESICTNREIENSRKAFDQMNLEQERERQTLEDERNQLLETVQDLIASQNYKQALESTSAIEVRREFGSSSELYEFNCNIIFYRTVALGEYALSSLDFNSSEQQQTINEALDFAAIAMQNSPERRARVRELALNLQQRVVARYLDGLGSVCISYAYKDMGIDEEDTDVFKILSMSKQKLSDRNRTASKEEVFGLMDQVVRGFEFVVSITDKRRILFSKALKKSGFQDIMLVDLVGACIRRMLISFDVGDYDAALRLSETIAVFTRENKGTIESHHKIFSFFPFFPECAHITPMLLSGIASFVKNLIPVYKFCNKKLQWRRFAGVLADDGTQEQFTYLENENHFEDLMTFTDMLMSVFECSERRLKDLVVSNMTRTFVFDNFLDPIYLAKRILEGALFGKNSEISRRVIPILKQFSAEGREMDSIMMESQSALSSFHKRKYDPLRVRLVRLSMSLLRLVHLFDSLLSMDSLAKERMMESFQHVLVRYAILPKVLHECNLLIRVLFRIEVSPIQLLRQLSVMQMDLDNADNFFLKVEDMSIVGVNLPAALATPELVRSYGIWSFSLTFNIFARSFLIRFALGEERRKLLVIDNIATLHILDFDSPSVEALAFDTIDMLIEFGARSFDQSKTPSILEAILGDERNHTWCHSFNNPNQRKRWAKQKARKYSKLICRLLDAFHNSEIQPHMTARKQSVDFLLEKLQISITQFRSLPVGLQAAIADTKNPAKIIEACKFVPQWEREDLHQMRVHILQLLEASEKVTGVLHRATGEAYPEAKSILNEKWEMKESLQICKGEFYSREMSDIIQDVKYVNAILEEFSRRRDLLA